MFQNVAKLVPNGANVVQNNANVVRFLPQRFAEKRLLARGYSHGLRHCVFICRCFIFLLLLLKAHSIFQFNAVLYHKFSKQPPVKTGGILEFKQSLSAVFLALHLDIFSYRGLTYANCRHKVTTRPNTTFVPIHFI